MYAWKRPDISRAAQPRRTEESWAVSRSLGEELTLWWSQRDLDPLWRNLHSATTAALRQSTIVISLVGGSRLVVVLGDFFVDIHDMKPVQGSCTVSVVAEVVSLRAGDAYSLSFE